MAGGSHGAPRVLPQGTPLPLQHRYVLENLLNGKVTESDKQKLTFATSKFDEQFVKGPPTDTNEDLKQSLSKQRRLNFSIEKEEIIARLHSLSEEIFRLESDEQKRICFDVNITEINSLLTKKEEEASDS
jgi:hypothetical protein